MTEFNGDNRDESIEEAVQKFVHELSEGHAPEIDEFVKQYPGLEQQLRKRIRNLHKIDTLFESLFQADKSDFKDVQTGHKLIGRKIGSFDIVKVIGSGAMGVVYLANDTKLDRSVAIKTIPDKLAQDSAARMRFQREAKILASLNHPNIAVIHDIIEPEQDTGYLVLEYVPGQTLAQRIAHKPLKLQEALSIGRQIAEAVAAAHEKGIVHRDLKPGNIKLTPEGRVKVLDFGLAKPKSEKDAGQDITVTQVGSIIGTPAYMSPEQIRGGSTNSRNDIWSFGCILYEMLTGKRPFEGKTVSDTVAHTLERQPDWQALPKQIPANIKLLIRRCLEKDPRRRLQHMGDAALEIDETLNLPAIAPPATDTTLQISQSTSIKRLKIIGAICLFLLGTCTGIAILRYISPGPEAIRPISRFFIRPSSKISADALWSHALAISPDGKQLVYVDEGQGGGNILYLRDMDDTQARLLPGTEGNGMKISNSHCKRASLISDLGLFSRAYSLGRRFKARGSIRLGWFGKTSCAIQLRSNLQSTVMCCGPENSKR
jgi:serine/threonine protein kinase